MKTDSPGTIVWSGPASTGGSSLTVTVWGGLVRASRRVRDRDHVGGGDGRCGQRGGTEGSSNEVAGLQEYDVPPEAESATPDPGQTHRSSPAMATGS